MGKEHGQVVVLATTRVRNRKLPQGDVVDLIWYFTQSFSAVTRLGAVDYEPKIIVRNRTNFGPDERQLENSARVGKIEAVRNRMAGAERGAPAWLSLQALYGAPTRADVYAAFADSDWKDLAPLARFTPSALARAALKAKRPVFPMDSAVTDVLERAAARKSRDEALLRTVREEAQALKVEAETLYVTAREAVGRERDGERAKAWANAGTFSAACW